MGSQDPSSEMWSFLVQAAESAQAGPRLARLTLRGKPTIQTPSYLVNTSRGVVPHVTPDLLQRHTSVSAIYHGLEDFIEKTPSHAPILKSSGNTLTISDFTGAGDHYFTVLGPRRLPTIQCPKQNTNSSIAISTSVGFSDLSITAYNEAVKKLRPDATVSVADVVVAETISRKRIERSADRTHAWLRDTIEARRAETSSLIPLLASIPPLEPEEQAFYLSDLASEYARQISGLCLYSAESVLCIPGSLHDTLRIWLNDPQSPHDLLKAITLGIDLVTVPFVTRSSEAGLAFTFSFLPSTDGKPMMGEKLPMAIDLWDSVYATDVRGLNPDCSCYTCTRHHRAYIHHLLQAKEMLAWNLLQVHNLHVLHEFFGQIQNSIARGTWEENHQTFGRSYETNFPLQSGVGPRIRGYHTKSTGGGEPKKNRKAYGRLEEHARKIEEAESGIVTPTLEENAEVLEQQGFAARTTA